MKNLELRSALIKSGALLALCIFLIYALAVGDSGGVGGTISSIISAIVFVVGLTIALIVSVSVLFGIYFGILYLYDPEVSKKTYEELRTIGDTFSVKLPIRPKCCSSKEVVVTVPTVNSEDLQAIEANQAQLCAQLDTIGSTIDTLQLSLAGFSSALGTAKEEISALEEKTDSLEEAIENKATTEAIDETSKKLSAELEGLKGSIKPIADKIASLEENIISFTSEGEKENEGIKELVNKAIETLKGEIKDVQNEVAKLSSPPSKERKPESTGDSDSASTVHRILSYFENKSDKNTFTASVKKGIDQGMTYAQIGEFLQNTLSKKASEIISDHPSLTKDYIRTIRQQS